jgi:hypothetical protein
MPGKNCIVRLKKKYAGAKHMINLVRRKKQSVDIKHSISDKGGTA